MEVKYTGTLPHPHPQGTSLVTMTRGHLGFKQTVSRGTGLGSGENPHDLVRGQLVGFIFGVGEQGAEVLG